MQVSLLIIPFGELCKVRGKFVIRTFSKKIDLLLQRRWLHVSTCYEHSHSHNTTTYSTGRDRECTGGEGVFCEIGLILVMIAAHTRAKRNGARSDIGVASSEQGTRLRLSVLIALFCVCEKKKNKGKRFPTRFATSWLVMVIPWRFSC